MTEGICLSVIIPTRNSAKQISACLDSIFSQTFKDIEVIIVDALSQDDTLSIVKDYAAVNDNLRYVSEPDKGIYDAMNKGIKMAKGNWLYFLGSDDHLYAEDVLETVFTESHLKHDVIYGNVNSEVLGNGYAGRFTFEKLLGQNICHQAIFFKRSVFDKTGLFYIGYKAHADWENNIKWFKDTRLSKLFLNITVAVFGAGGLSSTHHDPAFDNFLIWEKIKFEKPKYKRTDRLRLLKGSLIRARYNSDWRLFFNILKDAVRFTI